MLEPKSGSELRQSWYGFIWKVAVSVLTLVLIPIFVNIVSQHLTKEKPKDKGLTQDKPKNGGLTQDKPKNGALTQDKPENEGTFLVPSIGTSIVDIEPPFDKYLKAHPILMEVAGVKIIRLEDGRRVVLSVASTALKDNSPQDRLRAEKVCKIKAATGLLKENQGVQLAHVEQVREGGATTVLLDGGPHAAGVAEVLEMTTAKVEGVVKEMPPVGRWRSKDGKVYYLATGVILDAKGDPIHVADRP